MSRWYGHGGEWINAGLPNYVAIDRKPENGCEIQNAACGVSGVMLQLKLVKTTAEMNLLLSEDDREMLHGIVVLKQLVQPWFYSQRVVCADSYFASVGAAQELLRHQTRFIGVVKTATSNYPMAYLSHLEFSGRGDRHGVVSVNADGQATALAFVWVDGDRRYFIATASSLAEGTPINRSRLRQVVQDNVTDPEHVDLVIPQPRACETYYSCCAKIDQHNRDRQDTLMLEKKLKTHDWSIRVNLSILGMIMVDCWKVWSQITVTGPEGLSKPAETQKEFYSQLATELIDNTFDYVAPRNNGVAATDNHAELIDRRTNLPRSGTAIHLTPTKRKRKKKDGSWTQNTFQARCHICRSKTIYQCSRCKDESDGIDEGWLCHTAKGKRCFLDHLSEKHGE
jgi:hypothetical protein